MFQIPCRERSGQRPAADHAEAEAGPFFVREGDHFDGMPGPNARFVHLLHRFNGGQHAEGAVELPAPGHRVQMGTGQHDRQGGAGSFPAADQVAGGVFADGQAGFLHVTGHKVLRRPLFRGEGIPGYAAVRLFPDRPEFHNAVPQPLFARVHHSLSLFSRFASFILNRKWQ